MNDNNIENSMEAESTNINNISISNEIFSRANQSVDDFLKEIESVDVMDMSLPELASSIPTSPITLPLNVDNTIVLPIETMELNGPREFIDSPKKKVQIDVNPPQRLEYQQLSEYEGDESNSDQSLDQLRTLPWIKSNNKIQSKPLPKIVNSLSVQSMPNLNYDSEETIENSIESLSIEKIEDSNLNSCNKLKYDHLHYMQDMENGRLGKFNDAKHQLNDLKSQISVLPNLKSVDEIKNEQLIDNFSKQNDNDGTINRTDSVKSTMSIQQTKLETKKIDKNVFNLQLSNDQFETDNGIIERVFDDSESNKTNDLDISDDESNRPLNISKNHKRSSSLTELVTGFIRSVSSKSISSINNINNQFQQPPSTRAVSGISVTTTNTEGFVSAQEDLINPFELRSDMKIENKDDSPSTSDVDLDNDNTIVSMSDETDNQEENDENEVNCSSSITSESYEDTTEDLLTSNCALSDERLNSDSLREIDGAEKATNDDIIDQSKQEDSEEVDLNISSFNSDKFILKTSFDDDIYSSEFDEFNKALNFKTRISSTSTTNTSSNSRITSLEFSQKNEVLNIWSHQSLFAAKPTKKLNDFDSIGTPIKSAVIKQQKIKQLKVLTSSPDSSIFDIDEDLINKLQVIPSSIIPKHSKSKSINSIHANDQLIVNPFFNENTPLSPSPIPKIQSQEDHHFSFSSLNNLKIDDFSNVTSDTIIINKDQAFNSEKAKQDDYLLKTELSGFLDSIDDDSLSKIINDWDPRDQSELVNDSRHNLYNDNSSFSNFENNKTILKRLWNENTLPLEVNRLKPSLSINENFEDFINQKVIVHDEEFKIKKPETGKFHYHHFDEISDNTEFISPREEKATLFNLSNVSYSQIVPELGITQNPIEDHDKGDKSVDSFKTASSRLLLTPKKQTMAEVFRPQLSPTKNDDGQLLTNIQLSPAHKKMQDKMRQQVEMKKEQLKHQRLQSQLQKNIREEAIILAQIYPKRNESIKKVKEEDINAGELFESFDNKSPTLTEELNPFNSPSKYDPVDVSKAERVIVERVIEKKPELINGERGRLFLKINSIKEIKLPKIDERECKIQIIIDNGIHRLITDLVDLHSTRLIEINKEFELIVSESLDIIITLKLHYQKPKPQRFTIAEKKNVKAKSKLGRLFGKTETEIINKEIIKEPIHDPLSDWVALDGSFGKFKIHFDDYEDEIKCKVNEFNLKLLNEWKSNLNNINKRVLVEKPIESSTLNISMLFVPRTTKNEILPISISNAQLQVNESRKLLSSFNLEGFMFQEGGDMKTWTRRYYKLNGFDLLAFNDVDGKLKAKINLKKIKLLITSSNSASGERKFSDSLILDNGFKVCFNNNEIIEFGCESASQKKQWIDKLNELIRCNNFQKQPWLRMMIEKSLSNDAV